MSSGNDMFPELFGSCSYGYRVVEVLRLKNQVIHVDAGQLAIPTNSIKCRVEVSTIVVQGNGNASLDKICMGLLTTLCSCAVLCTILHARHVPLLSWRQ